MPPLRSLFISLSGLHDVADAHFYVLCVAEQIGRVKWLWMEPECNLKNETVVLPQY